MTVLRPRTRAITVRLSEDEFATLRQMCVATGARSVSDLARSAMHDILEGMSREKVPGTFNNEQNDQIIELARKVDELAAELASFKAQQPLGEVGS